MKQDSVEYQAWDDSYLVIPEADGAYDTPEGYEGKVVYVGAVPPPGRLDARWVTREFPVFEPDPREIALVDIRERAQGATRGPWVWEPWVDEQGGPELVSTSVMMVSEDGFVQPKSIVRGAWTTDQTDAVDVEAQDAEFIAHARADVEFLLGKLEAIEKACAEQIADYHSDDNAGYMSARDSTANKILDILKGDD